MPLPSPVPPAVSPLDRQSRELQRGEAVFRALRQAIQDGMYQPGDRLREEEVARRFDVSRTPVREALGRLVSKGMVVPAPGRGLLVRKLDPNEVLELYSMREILEGAAARLSAQHASVIEVEDIEALAGEFEGAADAPEMARLNRHFHEAIMRSARNRFLESALGEFQDGVALLGPTTFALQGRPAPAAMEHRAIAAAIAARDPDAAEAVARHHIREALRARLQLDRSA